jgi:hypothetical protein
MNFPPNIPKAARPVPRAAAQSPVRFGAGSTGITWGVDKVFKKLTEDRTTQMLVEDMIGFGVLRAGVDLSRGFVYGNNQMNWPAGFERIGRESASIATDNVLAGLVAVGMGKVIFDRMSRNKAAAFNNQFVDYPTLEAFQAAAGDLREGDASKEFLAKLAKSHFAQVDKEGGQTLLTDAWNNAKPINDLNKDSAAFLKKVAEREKGKANNGFSYVRKDKLGNVEKSFNLNTLLEDVRGFSQHMQKLEAKVKKAQIGKSWKTLATESIEHTLKAKAVTIPVGLGVATAATFAVPFVISAASRKFLGIDYYPGEIGLRKEDSKKKDKNQDKNSSVPHKSFWERHAPYLTESCKKGNYWPLFWTLAPLPLAAGMLNTTRLKYGLPVVVKSFKEWKQLLDYKKGWPFTAQQQMSSLFAVLITSRLLNSRSDNEYRERVLDSFVGWGAWIMGTPLLNKVAANLSDKVRHTQLVKADGTLRSRAEIDALQKIEGVGAEVLEKTRNSHIWMNAGTTLLTMGTLGVLIPWWGVKMTQNNERRKQKLREAQTPPMPPAPPKLNAPAKPWAVPAQPSPFAQLPNPVMSSSGFNAPRNVWTLPTVPTVPVQG